jgi:ketosteroid isomerase-like protein
MSEENVELARRVFEAWNEGGAESAKRFWAEDIEFHDPPDLPDSRVVQGRDAVGAYLTSQTEVVGDLKLNIVDARERGESVVLRMELTVHGAESGLDVPGEIAQVVEVANGKFQRVWGFLSWEEALEAAGLSE